MEVTAVADQPNLTVPATVALGEDEQSAPFAISSSLRDSDGSETLKLEIGDVPAGVQLSDGNNSFTGTPGNTTVDVTNWELDRLTIVPPADSDQDFVLTVTATAIEQVNSDVATRSDTIDVEVTARADQPTLTVPATVTVDEDTQTAVLSIQSELSDTDGSETLNIMIHSVPVGATLTDGTNVFTSSSGNVDVDVTSWALDGSEDYAAS